MKLDRIALHSFACAPLGADSVVLDCGGNRGEFSTGIVDRYGCRVVAVEAVPELAAAFPRRDERLEVVNAALSASSGPVDVNVNPTWCSGLHVAQPGSQRVAVMGVTLEELLAERSFEQVDLLKLDIEGEEIAVLAQAPAAVLLRCRQVTVEFHPDMGPTMPGRIDEVIARLRGLGFQPIFARGTEDVLFLHPDLRIGDFEYRATVLRYVHLRNRARWLHLGLQRRLSPLMSGR